MNHLTLPLRLPLGTRLVLALMQTAAALLLLLALTVALTAPAFATGGGHYPVTICHNGHTITVDDDAVPAHVKHGDTVGECTEPDPTPEPTYSATEEPTPWPTETSTPTPTPTDEPSTTPSPTSTPTAPAETPATASPPVTVPSASATASSGSTSPNLSPETARSEVATVATLAETGTGLRDGILTAAFVLGAGVLCFLVASRRRPR